MSRRVAITFALAAAALLGAFVWSLSRWTGEPQLAQIPDAIETSTRSPPPSSQAAPARIDAPIASPSSPNANASENWLQAMVTSTSGQPISGAKVYFAAASERSVALDDGRPHATTNASGEATLRKPAPRDDLFLLASAAGYRPDSRRLSELHTNHASFVLTPALCATVRCVSLDGAPMVDMTLALSRAGDAVLVPPKAALPGAQPKLALHAAVTGADGCARFDQLSPGHYAIVSAPAGAIQVDGPRSLLLDEKPREEEATVTLMFAEVLAAAVRLRGCKPVLHSIAQRRELTVGGDFHKTLEAVERQLRGRYSDALIFVTYRSRASDTDTVHVSATCADGGTVGIAVPLRPWQSPDVLTEVDPAPGSSVRCTDLTLLARDGAGRAIPGASAQLSATDRPRQGQGVLVQSGQIARVPVGAYRLILRTGILFARLGPRTVQLADQDAQELAISCAEPLQQLHLTVRRADGAAVTSGMLRFTRGKESTDLSLAAIREIPLLIPPGPVRIEYSGFGDLAGRLDLEVAGDPLEQRAEFVIE